MKENWAFLKKAGLLSLVLSGTLQAMAYNWSGKTGTVTLTEADGDVYVEESDGATVAALKGIILSGANSKVTFNNTSSLTLGCTITGDGTIVKKGSGDLRLGKPHDATIPKQHNSYWGDYYTKGGISVETGTLYMPQDGGALCWYGPLTIASGATVVTPADQNIGVDSLWGAGTLTNTCSMATNSNQTKSLLVGYYGDTTESHFSGKVQGRLGIAALSQVTLDGKESLSGSQFSVSRNTTDSANNKGLLAIAKFGKKGGASSIGQGEKYVYAAGDFAMSYGGRLNYIGDEAETTDKVFAFYGATTYIDKWIDAGAFGGVTFTGAWKHQDGGNMTGLVLKGSNTEDMVLSNEIISKHATKGGVMGFKKQGSGTWRFADSDKRTSMTGALFVEEGTLKYDSIAEIGENSSLGVSTECYKWARGTVAQDKIPANLLPYEILLGSANAVPTFDYSGVRWSSTTTRRIALTGSGARLSNNSAGGRVSLLGGVAPAPGETEAKTLYLAGSNLDGGTVGNISDGDGKVSVVKEGAGSWTLTRGLSFTGSLDVRAGRLTVMQKGGAAYKWYRLTFTQLGGKHESAEVEECPAVNGLYIRLRGLGLYDADGNIYKPAMTDVYPEGAADNNLIYPATFWQGLQPGQVTIGEYHGAQYNTYTASLPSNLFKDTAELYYNTYLACTPDKETGANWLPLVFRLPDDAPEICYYDLVCDQNYIDGQNGHIAQFQLEGSVDGIQWDLLHETDGCIHPTSNSRASRPDLTWVAGDNCVVSGFGYAIKGRPDSGEDVTSLASVSEIKLAAGATLAATGAVELPKLTVDCTGGLRTVEGFDFAKGGVLTVSNVPAGAMFELPVDFVNCTNLDRLVEWTIVIDGKPNRRYAVTVKDERLCFSKHGLLLIFK